MAIPQNAQAIWNFLVGQGFNANAAAGILGNMEQESGGSPTAGHNPPGAGLIQILGDPGGSLASELAKTMTYIRANGSVADINAHASSPSAAALYFSEHYERPLASAANNPNREQSATEVAAAAKSGNWPTASAVTTSATSPAGAGGAGNLGFFSLPGDITGFFHDANTFVTALMWITNPASWVRIGAFLAGVALLLIALYALIAVAEDKPLMPNMPTVIPIPV